MEKAIILKVQKDSPHDLAEVELVRNQPLIEAIYDKWKITGLQSPAGTISSITKIQLLICPLENNMLADDFRVQIDPIPNGRFEWMLWQLDDENFAYLLRDREDRYSCRGP